MKTKTIAFVCLMSTIATAGFVLARVAFASTPPPSGNPILGRCATCEPDGCRVDVNQFTQVTGPVTGVKCIDFDGDGIGHCCNIPGFHEDIIGKHGVSYYHEGDCYKYVCAAATVITPLRVCNLGWTPGSSAAHPFASYGRLPGQLSTPSPADCHKETRP